jgi:tetratricopeptide (TPR) repeat protein
MLPTEVPHRTRVPGAVVWVLGALLLIAACSKNSADGPSSALQPFKRGVQAYQDEDYQHAVKLFEQAASMDDRSANIYFNLGLSYYQLEAYPEAIEAYSKALKLDPRFADAHMNIALAYDRVYSAEQANAHYNEYLALVRAARQARGDSAQPTAGANGSTLPAAQVSKPSKPAMGGQPLSSLPGGPQPKKPGDATFQPGRPRSVPPTNGPRASVSELRRLPADDSKPQPAQRTTPDSNLGQPNQWWTQDTPPRGRRST